MATTRKRRAKPKVGRAFRAGEKTKLFSMRVTDDELERYRAATEAALAGSISEWIRATLEAEIARSAR